MFYFNLLPHRWYNAGADPGFQVRGGTLKKIAPSRGRRENIFGVFRVKNHDFTPKNHIFPILGGAREMFGVFHVKNHDFTPKKIIFLPILGGRAPGAPPPPESAPAYKKLESKNLNGLGWNGNASNFFSTWMKLGWRLTNQKTESLSTSICECK
jgi:hypothetical protein